MLQKFIIEIYMLFLARFPSINHKVLTLARKADGYNVHHKNGGEWRFIKSKKVLYIQLEYNVHQFYRGHNLKSLAELIPEYVAYIGLIDME